MKGAPCILVYLSGQLKCLAGPFPTFVDVTDTAPQRHQTSHSCIAQQFQEANTERADEAEFTNVLSGWQILRC